MFVIFLNINNYIYLAIITIAMIGSVAGNRATAMLMTLPVSPNRRPVKGRTTMQAVGMMHRTRGAVN